SQCHVLCGDIRTLNISNIDAVVMNPPYFPADSGLPSSHPEKDQARYERWGTLQELVYAAANTLNPGGWFYGIIPASREQQLNPYMQQAYLQPQRLRRVHTREHQPAHLVMLGGFLNATGCRTMCLDVEEPLVVHQREGRAFSREVIALLAAPT